MTKHARAKKVGPTAKSQRGSAVKEQTTDNPVALDSLPDGTIHLQAEQLREVPMQRAQQQTLAAQIGRVGGNRSLQRAVAARESEAHPAVERQATVQCQDRPPGEGTEVTGHVTTLGQAISPEVVRFIDEEIVREMERGWTLLISNYKSGMARFTNYMQFPPEAEAEANYLKVSMQFAGEQLLKAAVDKVKEVIPGFDIAVDYVKELVKEHDRAAAAAARIKVRDYIEDVSNGIDAKNAQFLQNIGDLDTQVQAEFQRRAAAAPSELSQPTTTIAGQRAIAGPGAEYLNSLRRAAVNWKTTVPGPAAFLQQIVEQWVRRREGEVESKGGGAVYMGGRIYLEVKLIREDGSVRVTEMPRKGRLASEEADRAGDALKRIMREQNLNVNSLDLIKNLTIDVEDEVFGFNDHYRIHMQYRNPGTILHQQTIPSPVSGETVRKAPTVEREALQAFDIRSIDVRELEAY